VAIRSYVVLAVFAAAMAVVRTPAQVVAGFALFGLGMAGWMLPLGVIREHTDVTRLGWRTGVYRVGVDGAIFLGPLLCGVLGETHTRVFIALVGVAAVAIAVRLGRG